MEFNVDQIPHDTIFLANFFIMLLHKCCSVSSIECLILVFSSRITAGLLMKTFSFKQHHRKKASRIKSRKLSNQFSPLCEVILPGIQVQIVAFIEKISSSIFPKCTKSTVTRWASFVLKKTTMKWFLQSIVHIFLQALVFLSMWIFATSNATILSIHKTTRVKYELLVKIWSPVYIAMVNLHISRYQL